MQGRCARLKEIWATKKYTQMNYREKIGTKDSPLKLKTPPLSSEYTMHIDEKDGVDILVCTVGKTVLHYDLRCIEDLHEMLKNNGDRGEN